MVRATRQGFHPAFEVMPGNTSDKTILRSTDNARHSHGACRNLPAPDRQVPPVAVSAGGNPRVSITEIVWPGPGAGHRISSIDPWQFGAAVITVPGRESVVRSRLSAQAEAKLNVLATNDDSPVSAWLAPAGPTVAALSIPCD